MDWRLHDIQFVPGRKHTKFATFVDVDDILSRTSQKYFGNDCHCLSVNNCPCPQISQEFPLTRRQLRFLVKLQEEGRSNAGTISHHWQVSRRTAKRDNAYLAKHKIIRFSGARKNGYYVLNSPVWQKLNACVHMLYTPALNKLVKKFLAWRGGRKPISCLHHRAPKLYKMRATAWTILCQWTIN